MRHTNPLKQSFDDFCTTSINICGGEWIAATITDLNIQYIHFYKYIHVQWLIFNVNKKEKKI